MKYEIKEPGFWGKTVYIYEGGYVKKPGFWGQNVYKIDGNYIKEPKFLGKTLFYIKGNSITEPKMFGRELYSIKGNSIYQGRNLLYEIKEVGSKGIAPIISTPTTDTKKSEPSPTVSVGVTIKVEEHFDRPEYNELLAYRTFFSKHKTVMTPDKQQAYSNWALGSCGVENPKKLHKELFDLGFYSKANIEDTLSQCKVSEIQECVKSLGITVKGKKNEIIQQISENSSIDDVNRVLGAVYYSTNEKAATYLTEHQIEYDYYDLDDETLSLEEYLQKRKTFSKNDLRWQSYTNELRTDKTGFGRNAYDKMHDLLVEEGKMKDALLCMLKVLFLEFNDIENYERMKPLISSPDDELLKEHMVCMVDYGETMEELKDYFDNAMVDKIYSEMFPNFQPCSKKLFIEIVKSMFDGTFRGKMEDYEKKLTRAFKAAFREKL